MYIYATAQIASDKKEGGMVLKKFEKFIASLTVFGYSFRREKFTAQLEYCCALKPLHLF